MTPLEAMRIFGPISIDDIANRLDAPWIAVMEHVLDLEKQGYVERLGGGGWDVTEAGRASLKTQSAVAMDGARECVGIGSGS